ncbi:MAG: hypothetical protein ACJA1A_001770 [Saprospiraceae bacterium]|jgi:hypothetical protein
MIKKVLKIIGFLFFSLIIAAAAVPYFFKDRIVEAVKVDINKNFNAKVDFDDVSLSLFKSFPDFNFSLDQLSITGINEFEGYKLLDAKKVELSLDLMSVFSDTRPIEIKSVSFQKPEINIKVLENGKANYDIVKTSNSPSDEVASENYNFSIQLDEYEITDGELVYDDRLGGTYVELIDLDHKGKGEFTQDVFDIITTSKIASLTAKSGGITYLDKAIGGLDLTINADMVNSKFTIKDNALVINALRINTEGFIQLEGDVINMDIKYNAPKNNFKNLLSMVPSAFTKDFQDVQANGSLILDGFVRGGYNSKTGVLPSFLANLKVENGDFKYPDLPLGIKDINTEIKINSPSSDLNKMVVDISNFKMELGNNPIEAKMKLWNLLSDPSIDSKIKGKINLEELAKAFPMKGINKLSGIITSNLTAKTSMSAIDAQDLENIEMSGDLRIENLDYKSLDFPQIQVTDMEMNFSPKYVKLDRFEAQLGKSDISAEGTIDNILAYFSPEKIMVGKLKIRSNFFDSNEWISQDVVTTPPSAPKELANEQVKVFDRFSFIIDGEISKLLYDVYDLRDSKLVGKITPYTAEIDVFQTTIGESDFKMNGRFTNVFNYLFENETLEGSLNLTSDYINANEFLVEETEVEEVFPVPEKMDLNINANIGEVLYTNIPLQNIKGEIKIANEVAIISNGTANTLGGNVIMNGSYNTQNIKEPKFDMDYNVSSLDYQDAFDKLNTFQALAPIGKFIEGKFNTTLKMSGTLGKDMLPDLSTLSADGFLQTIEGTLKNFKPIEEFANKLNINSLKSINLKNTKNWFELNNGEIKIKDFDFTSNGIDMVIGGTHGLNTEMAYNIKAKIPQQILQQNAVGQAADNGLKFLQGQASKLGINLDQGEFINVNALISGSVTKPKIKLDLLSSDGKVASLDNIVDNIKDNAIDKANEVIKDKTGVDAKNIKEEVREVKEDLSAKADAEIAILMDKTEQNIKKIKSEAEKRADQTKIEAKKLSEKTKAEGYKQADDLVEQAGGNVFKKKAAELAAKKLREETDKKAEQIIIQGNDTAKGIMDVSDKQTEKLQATADNQAIEIRKKYEQ